MCVNQLVLFYIAGPPTTPEAMSKGLDRLQDTIQMVVKSIEGQPPWNPFDLPMFDISATSRLLPPSFPRAVQLMSLPETLDMFSTLSTHLQSVVNMPRKMGLVETMDYFDRFSYSHPSILVRSLLLYHYMPCGTGKIFNRCKLVDLVSDEIRTFSCPPLFNPALKAGLMAHEHVKMVWTAFLSSAAHVLDNLFAAKCNTRARQRERLAYLLEELGVLQSEAERVDSVVDVLIRDKLGDKTVSHLTSAVGTCKKLICLS